MLLLSNLRRYSYWLSPFIIVLVLSIPVLSLVYLYDLSKEFEFSNYISSITFFSFYQSLLSALLSVVIGAGFAFLLIKHNYIYGIKFIINSLSTLFVLPTIITIFGILSFYGKFIQLLIYSYLSQKLCYNLLTILLNSINRLHFCQVI